MFGSMMRTAFSAAASILFHSAAFADEMGGSCFSPRVVDGTISLNGEFHFTASTSSCPSGVFFDAPIVQPCVVPSRRMTVNGKRTGKRTQLTLDKFARLGLRGCVVGSLSEDGTFVIVEAITTLE